MVKCQYCSGVHEAPGDCNSPKVVLESIEYKDWEFKVADDQSYFQVEFWAPCAVLFPLGEELQTGRKWRLSPHMTRSEIVQTALKAVLAAEEHEAREQFKYRGQAIFGPHFNVDALHKLAEQGANLDARSDVKTA